MKRKMLAYLAVLFVLVQIPNPLHAQDPEADSLLALADELSAQMGSLFEQGLYGEAVALAERALEISENVLGSEHLDVATALNDLSFAYTRLSRVLRVEERLQLRFLRHLSQIDLRSLSYIRVESEYRSLKKKRNSL